MINFNESPIRNVIEILLRDMNSGRNIFFNGRELLKKNLPLIKPRALKSDAEKFLRTRKIAEVFTPTKIVKQMVDALDDKKIDSRWLEITCGEAPFITNRYDAESGEKIPFENRAGILDRKLRAAKNFSEAKRAVQSVYGYELQGDSLLIARANVLLTFADAVKDFSENDLAEVAEIISWNFFQFDGLKESQPLFGEEIIDWTSGRKFVFGGNTMKKFDFVIGNPPYQEETDSDSTRKLPVYDKLMEAAQKVGEKVELITPARFLFNQGDTPKDFNQRMLNDEHLKVLDYSQDAGKYFKGVDIEGGVAITLRDETKNFGAIGTFIPFDELKSIHQKVVVDNENFRPLNEIIYPRAIYRFVKDNSFVDTNAFEKMRDFFFDEKPDDGNEYIKIFGLIKNRRYYKWIRRNNVTNHETLNKFKVFVPQANGSGAIGTMPNTPLIGTPIIGEPLVGNTATFTVIGNFDTRAEADACLKYIKSKFCRAMLGILKVTQHNPPQTWAKVPLQDFTSASDIDWSVSIPEIDAQLYKKYGLDAAEINFIEEKVRPME